jgi:hypothetical protein
LNLIFQDAFRRHDAYKTALKYAFEDMMHTRGNRLAELMAKYIDGKLRTKGSMEEEVHVRAKPAPIQTKRLPSSAYSRICAPSQMELALDNVMELFRYLNAKDVRALLCSRCNRCEYRRRAWLTRLFPHPCLLCRCLRHFTKRTWQRGSCSARARRLISRSR